MGAFQEAEEFHGEGQDEGGVLLGGDGDDGLEQAQLERGGGLGHLMGGFGELLGRLEFGVGVDDAGPALAVGLGLAGHGALHRVGQGDVLDLDPVDLHAPADGGAVDHQFQALVEFLAVGQQVVQVALADDGPQGGLGHLGDGEAVVLDVDQGRGGVDDLEVDDRVDADRDVVAGDALLGRDRQGDDLQIDLVQAVHDRNDQGETGPAHLRAEPAEPEHHTPLVLLDDPRRRHHIDRSGGHRRRSRRHQLLDHHGPQGPKWRIRYPASGASRRVLVCPTTVAPSPRKGEPPHAGRVRGLAAA